MCACVGVSVWGQRERERDGYNKYMRDIGERFPGNNLDPYIYIVNIELLFSI